MAPSSAMSVLSLSPGSTVMYHFYLWNIVTGGLFEPNIFKMIVCVVLFFFLGRIIERLWMTERLLKFLGITHVVTGVICFVFNSLSAILTANSDKSSHHLFGAKYGCGGIVAAIMVAYALEWPTLKLPIATKKFIGDDVSTIKCISLLLFFVSLTSTFGIPWHDTQIIWLHTTAAWVYLRFFERHDGYSGNNFDHFAFHCFFPELCRKVIEPASDIAWRVLNCYGCLSTESGEGFKALRGHGSSGTQNLPSAQVAERRRLRALKELDAKLAQLADLPEISIGFDDYDDEGEDDDNDDDYDNDMDASNDFLDNVKLNLLDSVSKKSSNTNPSPPQIAIEVNTSVSTAMDTLSSDEHQRKAVASVIAALNSEIDDVGSLASKSEDDSMEEV